MQENLAGIQDTSQDRGVGSYRRGSADPRRDRAGVIQVLNAQRREMPCCSSCTGSPVSWTGPMALVPTSKCLMLLLKLETPSGRVIPRHTAECQAVLQEHQWEGDKPVLWGRCGAGTACSQPGGARPAFTTGFRVGASKGRTSGLNHRSASCCWVPAAASQGSGHAAGLWASPARAQMSCVTLHLHGI